VRKKVHHQKMSLFVFGLADHRDELVVALQEGGDHRQIGECRDVTSVAPYADVYVALAGDITPIEAEYLLRVERALRSVTVVAFPGAQNVDHFSKFVTESRRSLALRSSAAA